jgi:hypothetical protein
MMIMTFALVYMHRVIDKLHQEQQEMRTELAYLGRQAGASNLQKPGDLAQEPVDNEFLASKAAALDKLDKLRVNSAGSVDELGVSQVSPSSNRFVEHDLSAHGDMAHPEDEHHDPRRLGPMFKVGNTKGMGCFRLFDTGSIDLDLRYTHCGGATACYGAGQVSTVPNTPANCFPCPPCFIMGDTTPWSNSVALKVKNCASALWSSKTSVSPGAASTRTGVYAMQFINAAPATRTLTITAHDSIPTSNVGDLTPVYTVPPQSSITAYCSVDKADQKLIFPSAQIPVLTIEGNLGIGGNFDQVGIPGGGVGTGTFTTGSGSVTLNGATTVSGSNTFTSGTGAVTLNGATTVADDTNFAVGSSSSTTGSVDIFTDVTIGTSSLARALTLNGNFGQATTPTAFTFTTGNGQITLNGHVKQDDNKNFVQGSSPGSGTGTFQTGTGGATFNGNIVQSGTNTFATGSGTNTLGGDVTISSPKTLTVAGGVTDLQAVTVQGDLTLSGPTSSFSMTPGTGTFSTSTSPATNAVQFNGDVTLASGKDITMAGASTFTTGTGTVTLAGPTNLGSPSTFPASPVNLDVFGEGKFRSTVYVDAPANFVVGGPVSPAPGTNPGSLSTFYGDITIGLPATADFDLTLHGAFEQKDKSVPTPGRNFKTNTEGTVEINGDVSIATGKDLKMASAGAGEFVTGSGAVTINGPVTMQNPGSAATPFTAQFDAHFTVGQPSNPSAFGITVEAPGSVTTR